MSEFEQSVVELYISGLSKENVAKQLRISYNKVSTILKVNNVQNRKTVKDTIDVNQLKLDYESGIGTLALSKKYNCSTDTVRKLLRKAGTKVEQKSPVADRLRENKEIIVSRYLDGESTYRLGRDFGAQDAHIYLFLRDTCGVTMRENTEKRFEDWAQKAKELIESGMTVDATAKMVGCSPTSVHSWMRTLGVDTSKYSTARDIPLNTQSEEIIKDYLAGSGCTILSRKYETSETSITKIITAAGIDPLYTRKYNVQHDYFENIDSWFKAYWLGWLVTDGNNYDMNSVRLCITDKEICEKFNETLNNENPIKFVKRRKEHHKDQYNASVNSSKMCEDLAKWGVVPNKTHQTYFPDIPEEFWGAFILGCTEGDGSILTKPNKNGTYNGCWSLIGNYKLLLGIAERMSRKLDIHFKFYKTKCNGNIQILRTRFIDETIDFLDYLYKDAPFYLARKHDKYMQLKINLDKGNQYDSSNHMECN